MALVTQREMSHAQMAVSNHPMNVPSHVPSNINNVKIKIIADGAMESGRIALVREIKSDASHAGMGIRTKQPTIAPKKISQFHVSVVMHHRIVKKYFFFVNFFNKFSC